MLHMLRPAISIPARNPRTRCQPPVGKREGLLAHGRLPSDRLPLERTPLAQHFKHDDRRRRCDVERVLGAERRDLNDAVALLEHGHVDPNLLIAQDERHAGARVVYRHVALGPPSRLHSCHMHHTLRPERRERGQCGAEVAGRHGADGVEPRLR
eukprot:scaffold14068_cov119-Isochrysis_galbana.AAC.10